LIDVAALLARADAYVGNDSGITHLAAAMGARGVAIFGPTAARRWAPRGDGIGTLESSNGLAITALAPERVWRVLAHRGCLDKLQGRT
jgi:ADP-heptose:LPS heptosyltransferase